MMKFCPECGSKLNETVKFCYECGFNITEFKKGIETTTTQKMNKALPGDDAQKAKPFVAVATADEKNEHSPMLESKSKKAEAVEVHKDVEEAPVTSLETIDKSAVVLDEEPVEPTADEDELEIPTLSEEDEKLLFADDDIEEPEVSIEDKEPEIVEVDKADVKPDPIDDTDVPNFQAEGLVKCTKIKSTFTKDDFVRYAWLEFARQNVDEELFNSDFEPVSVTECQVYEKFLNAKVSFTASIGYDREEPYIDYETYYEKEPYIGYEEYYDKNLQCKMTRQVTKYKDVKRQRQVTKYKKVTDWNSYANSTTVSGIGFAENFDGPFYESLFVSSFVNRDESLAEECEGNDVRESAKSDAMRNIAEQMHKDVEKELPGDRSKDVLLKIDEITGMIENLYDVELYTATINFKGKNYQKYAYPFGEMPVDGDKIKNEKDPYQIELELRKKAKEENEKDEKGETKEIWMRDKLYFAITMVLILASSIVSCTVRYLAPVIILFVLSLASFIVSMIFYKKNAITVKNEIKDRIKERNKKLESDVMQYSENYSKKMFEALNKKLLSLGLEPFGEDEFYGRKI